MKRTKKRTMKNNKEEDQGEKLLCVLDNVKHEHNSSQTTNELRPPCSQPGSGLWTDGGSYVVPWDGGNASRSGPGSLGSLSRHRGQTGGARC